MRASALLRRPPRLARRSCCRRLGHRILCGGRTGVVSTWLFNKGDVTIGIPLAQRFEDAARNCPTLLFRKGFHGTPNLRDGHYHDYVKPSTIRHSVAPFIHPALSCGRHSRHQLRCADHCGKDLARLLKVAGKRFAASGLPSPASFRPIADGDRAVVACERNYSPLAALQPAGVSIVENAFAASTSQPCCLAYR
jgi:hypothetical protein